MHQILWLLYIAIFFRCSASMFCRPANGRLRPFGHVFIWRCMLAPGGARLSFASFDSRGSRMRFVWSNSRVVSQAWRHLCSLRTHNPDHTGKVRVCVNNLFTTE